VRGLRDADPPHSGVAKVLAFLPSLPEALTRLQSETSPSLVASELLGGRKLTRSKTPASAIIIEDRIRTFFKIEEISDVKRICRYLPLTFLLLCGLKLATAQSLIDVNLGFGSAHDKASTTGIDQNTYGSCALTASTCSATTGLGGFFLGLGANMMLWKHFGVGVDATLQPGKTTFATIPASLVLGTPTSTLQFRETFYDFNGIYQPVNTKKATLQLIGGIGGANTKFYESYVASGSPLGGTNTSQYASSANHFQIHAGAGVQIYLTDHVYIRPQFDFHYVPNFTEQFGSSAAIQGMVWIGYTMGDR
jgi:hypothetical protein